MGRLTRDPATAATLGFAVGGPVGAYGGYKYARHQQETESDDDRKKRAQLAAQQGHDLGSNTTYPGTAALTGKTLTG